MPLRRLPTDYKNEYRTFKTIATTGGPDRGSELTFPPFPNLHYKNTTRTTARPQLISRNPPHTRPRRAPPPLGRTSVSPLALLLHTTRQHTEHRTRTHRGGGPIKTKGTHTRGNRGARVWCAIVAPAIASTRHEDGQQPGP